MDEKLLKITSWAGLDRSGLKPIFHLKAHSLIFAKSLLGSEELIVTSWTTEKSDMLSANSLQSDDMNPASCQYESRPKEVQK